MDADSVIIDISSDEENCLYDSVDISEEWINELLGCVDIEMQGDLDDVMVLDELSAPSCMNKLIALQKDSDDDCLVLDGDPDKLISVVDGSHYSDGLDDLVIVGEKGHLACRDYPHPRHLCINFPFNSTPHEKHCKLCHCYVCDSPAPCIYWGSGTLATDHCHSTEKGKSWKALRNIVKRQTTTASGPLCFPRSNQSHMQSFRSSHDIYNPIPCSQNASRPSTTGSATAIPDPTIQHRPLGSSISGLRTRPVHNPIPCAQNASRHSTTGSATAIPDPTIQHGPLGSSISGLRTRPVHNPIPCSQNASWRSTAGSATAIPHPSIQSERQLLGSSINSLRTRSVNQGTLHHIETQSYPSSHTSVRTMPVPTYSGSIRNGSSGSSSQGLAVSKHPQKTAAHRFHYSELQGSHRKPLVSPQANSQSMQPEASNDMNKMRGILASIEADLLGTDNYSESATKSNMPPVSSRFPAISKPSVLTSASSNIDVFGAYVSPKSS